MREVLRRPAARGHGARERRDLPPLAPQPWAAVGPLREPGDRRAQARTSRIRVAVGMRRRRSLSLVILTLPLVFQRNILKRVKSYPNIFNTSLHILHAISGRLSDMI